MKLTSVNVQLKQYFYVKKEKLKPVKIFKLCALGNILWTSYENLFLRSCWIQILVSIKNLTLQIIWTMPMVFFLIWPFKFSEICWNCSGFRGNGSQVETIWLEGGYLPNYTRDNNIKTSDSHVNQGFQRK